MNETLVNVAFGAACGVAGTTALLGILSWAWRRIALWWISRKIRLDLLKTYPEGHGTAPPPPPCPTPEVIREMVRGMGLPLQGAAAGVQACHDDPARPTRMVSGAYPGVVGSTSLPGGEVVFLVRVTDCPADACPCCRNPLIVAGGGGIPFNPYAKPPSEA